MHSTVSNWGIRYCTEQIFKNAIISTI